MKIDLNADLGEGCASDAELLTLVSSANIACGFHAGDAQIMQACVREAIKNGVAIGAHPSFPDRENFGRSAMQLPPETVYAQTLYQIGALATIARAQGGVMRHVKPHGMLYNQAAKEAQLADAIARAGIRLRSGIDSRWAGRKRADSCRQAIWSDNARGSVCRSRLSG